MSSTPKLSPFSYAILALVGRHGAGPHDIVRMMREGRVFWTTSESHFYAEPKRLAKVRSIELYREIDVRPALPAISAPTWCSTVAATGSSARQGRFLAEAIPGARYVELEGADHMAKRSATRTCRSSARRGRGVPRRQPTAHTEVERSLATILIHRHRRLDRDRGVGSATAAGAT